MDLEGWVTGAAVDVALELQGGLKEDDQIVFIAKPEWYRALSTAGGDSHMKASGKAWRVRHPFPKQAAVWLVEPTPVLGTLGDESGCFIARINIAAWRPGCLAKKSAG